MVTKTEYDFWSGIWSGCWPLVSTHPLQCNVRNLIIHIWLPCLLWSSSRPRRCPRFPCTSGPVAHSGCSRCGHTCWTTFKRSQFENYEITCRSCRWRGTFHRGRTPHCTLAPCAWVGTHCHYQSLSNQPILRSGNKKMFSPHDVLLAHLVSLWTLVPLSTSHNRTVESKEALARTRFMFGLFVPADV